MYYYEIDPTHKSYEDFIQNSEYWGVVCYYYDHSNLPKYCFVCDNPNYQLHHEDYAVLGKELKKGLFGNWVPQWKWIRKLVPLCGKCHKWVHIDEVGEKVPLRHEFLRERRVMLRKQYVRNQLRPTRFLPFLYRIGYRFFW